MIEILSTFAVSTASCAITESGNTPKIVINIGRMKTREMKELKDKLIILFLYVTQACKLASKLTKNFIIDCRIKMKKQAILLIIMAFVFGNSTADGQTKESFFGSVNTVVIDAGHGGKDKGCLGAKSYEKDVALSISLKLGTYLEETFENLNVIYTRKEDVFLELHERAEIANKNKADLFICVHANAAHPNAYGTETFVMGNAKNKANMEAAKRENSSILLEDNYEEHYENFDPNSPESYIAMTIMQSSYQSHSVHFAELVQQQFRERVGRRDRGVKMAPFLVLHQTTMPAVLIETGFLTNPEEEKFLTSDIGQDYIASAIFRAFRDYKNDIEHKSKFIVFKEVDKKMKEGKGLIFKVKLASSGNKIDTSPENFNGLKGVRYTETKGVYRYTYGAVPNWDRAIKLKEEVKEKGFHEAFIIAFYNGKRIQVDE